MKTLSPYKDRSPSKSPAKSPSKSPAKSPEKQQREDPAKKQLTLLKQKLEKSKLEHRKSTPKPTASPSKQEVVPEQPRFSF